MTATEEMKAYVTRAEEAQFLSDLATARALYHHPNCRWLVEAKELPEPFRTELLESVPEHSSQYGDVRTLIEDIARRAAWPNKRR